MRGLLSAFRFLTRLPLPGPRAAGEGELTAAAVWFPLVGLVIGLLLIAAAMPGMIANHWLAALLVVLAWIAITGGLHLDGAADLADALGASHRDPERFLAVMKEPHTGSFGVVAIVAILMSKLVAVAWIVESAEIDFWVLLLIPAWARLGALYWSQSLAALAPGRGEDLSRRSPDGAVSLWGALLFALSLLLVSLPFALVAVAALLLWRLYLKRRLDGMNGDCLGAGIEYGECIMLLAAGLF